MRIQRSGDCGNSPKNKFAEDFTVAVLTGDRSALEDAIADEFQFDVIGGPCHDQETFLRESENGFEAASGLAIEHVKTHGRAGAVNGDITLQEGGTKGFCLVLEFASAKADRVARARYYRP